MTVWMAYETDGDSGYYRIALFSTLEKAEEYLKALTPGYGQIKVMVVN